MKLKYLLYFVVSCVMINVNISCGGGSSTQNTTPTEAPKSMVTTTLDGEAIYKKNCLVCHQANGEGLSNSFPPLAKSDFLLNKEAVIQQVIFGKSGELVVNGVTYNNAMPPQNLQDDEIAAVLTYVYSNWGNSGGPIRADEVKLVRAKP